MQHTIHFRLLPRCRMRGAILPLHIYFHCMVLKWIQGQLLYWSVVGFDTMSIGNSYRRCSV